MIIPGAMYIAYQTPGERQIGITVISNTSEYLP